MQADDSNHRTSVRYEPNDKPPKLLTFGLALQFTILCIAGVVLTPAIVVRAAGGSEAYLSWAVFAAVAVSGITTVLQAIRLGCIGAGYVLLMGTSGAFIAVCVAALAKGGPAMLATLVVISSLFQFLLAMRLSLLRRVLTPTVAGTVIMLIAVTVMPIAFDMLVQVPEGSPPMAAPVSALTTIVVMAGLALRATGSLRLWAPVVGVVIGSVIASLFGLYDAASVKQATWAGIPNTEWPGFDLSFGPLFWTLLPSFVFVTLVGAIETIGDSVAIQRVSWRKPRAVDFRAVQGAVAADGVGNLLSGLIGTMPNTTYSTSIAITELTGVGARLVGIVIGAIFIALAFLPKALAVVLAIPAPVAAAYIAVLLAMLFVTGMKIVTHDGIDYRKGLVVGVSFWAGVGLQNGVIFPEYFSELAGGLLQNGMTTGGLVAILMTLFMELTAPRRHRLEVDADFSSLPEVIQFLDTFARDNGWDTTMINCLKTAGEETLTSLIASDNASSPARRLLLIARKEDGGAVLEFIAATSQDNLQDQLTLVNAHSAEVPDEREISLRLLRHIASSVRHEQYHNTEIITVHVDAPRIP